MDLYITGFINDRLEEIAGNLRKTNGEYAQAVKMCKELREEIDPIIMNEKDLALCVGDFLNFQEYLQHEFTIAAIEQRAFYKQGYLDCVDLLQGLGVLR